MNRKERILFTIMILSVPGLLVSFLVNSILSAIVIFSIGVIAMVITILISIWEK